MINRDAYAHFIKNICAAERGGMEIAMTPVAQWLNTTFESFDHTILEFFHDLAVSAGDVLTPIAETLGFLGELSWFTVVIAIVLLLFAKTRKGGVAMIFSVLIGSVFTNLCIKNLVARPRPYTMGYDEWWQAAGASTPSEFSFPSGHATAVTATILALCLFLLIDAKKHRWIVAPAALYALVMGASRIYLVVHYPTDVIGGIITGSAAAILGYLLASKLFSLFEKYKCDQACAFILEADVRHRR